MNQRTASIIDRATPVVRPTSSLSRIRAAHTGLNPWYGWHRALPAGQSGFVHAWPWRLAPALLPWSVRPGVAVVGALQPVHITVSARLQVKPGTIEGVPS